MKEEEIILESDIPVICIVADSFPDGVMDAHKKLHSRIPFSPDRRYFSLSWHKEGGGLHYQAAAEILDPKEADIEDGVSFAIRKGKYSSIIIHDFMNNIPAIAEAFDQLLKNENMDPNGYGLEWYLSREDVRCMVPLI